MKTEKEWFSILEDRISTNGGSYTEAALSVIRDVRREALEAAHESVRSSWHLDDAEAAVRKLKDSL